VVLDLITEKFLLQRDDEMAVWTDEPKPLRGCTPGIIYYDDHDYYLNLTKGKTMSDIDTRLKAMIVKQIGVDEKKVTDEACFIDDLGCDSLDVVELIMATEEEFHIEISDDEAEKLDTVGKLTAFVKDAKPVS
jgi:acyl carrier protein